MRPREGGTRVLFWVYIAEGVKKKVFVDHRSEETKWVAVLGYNTEELILRKIESCFVEREGKKVKIGQK